MQKSGPVTLIRWFLGLVTCGVVTSGAIYLAETDEHEYDLKFFGLLLVALLPGVLYLARVRSARATFLGGIPLLSVTLSFWLPVFDGDALGAIIAVPVTLTISAVAAARDRSWRRKP